jgi:Xanthosine triphosphate pyrophosphatase
MLANEPYPGAQPIETKICESDPAFEHAMHWWTHPKKTKQSLALDRGPGNTEGMSGQVISLLASSNNAHKVREIRAILSPSFWVADLSALHEAAPSVEETGLTFEENAALKAIAISRIHDGWVIADDSGLEVDALGGAPGVYSARYAGQAATDAENNKLLLENLEGVQGKDRTARFRCVIALARQGKVVATFFRRR